MDVSGQTHTSVPSSDGHLVAMATLINLTQHVNGHPLRSSQQGRRLADRVADQLKLQTEELFETANLLKPLLLCTPTYL